MLGLFLLKALFRLNNFVQTWHYEMLPFQLNFQLFEWKLCSFELNAKFFSLFIYLCIVKIETQYIKLEIEK